MYHLCSNRSACFTLVYDYSDCHRNDNNDLKVAIAIAAALLHGSNGQIGWLERMFGRLFHVVERCS